MDNDGARKLIASILRQAHEDYVHTTSCPEWCTLYDTCENKNIDHAHCDAKEFIHSAWCATLCDGVDKNVDNYINTAIQQCRLSKNTYKFVEGELRNYRFQAKALKEFKDNILYGTPVKQEGGKSNLPGDPTCSKTIAMLTDRRTQKLRESVEAIEEIYRQCDNRQRRLMDEYYFDNKYTTEGIAYRLDVDRRTINRWKQKIVYAVAIKLGYL